MELRVERRAEIALRSLQKTDQRQIQKALNDLSSADRASLRNNSKIHMLVVRMSGVKLFTYRANARLRLVLSFDNETCILEDIVDHDRLERFAMRGGRE